MKTGMMLKKGLAVAGLAAVLAVTGTPVRAACEADGACGLSGEAGAVEAVAIPGDTVCDASGAAVTGAVDELVKRGLISEAVRVIDESAEMQRRQHAGTPYSVGPLVWAARLMRDMDRPLSALVRYRSILGRLEAHPDTAWAAIVHEDIGGILASLGRNQQAYVSYAAAIEAFRASGNAEAVRRVSLKMPALLQ
ncbi:MAG TPA: hypothetical protein PLP29_12880 [Candidatus Ozemobacteraceae bacterium]|mgnify:CR=1 FL=1|nr:hypothetical protein [Candidatus Ozemobacteraceae bacterium]